MTGNGTAARWMRGSPSTALADAHLLPREAMWRVLEYERLRSDRSGHGFSLLKLRVAKEEDVSPVARALLQRLRSTDLAGLIHDDQIGVFLPGTPEFGAFKVADDALALLPAHVGRPRCEVYVYPHPYWPRESEPERKQPAAVDNGHRNGCGGVGENGRIGDNGHADQNGHAAVNGQTGPRVDGHADHGSAQPGRAQPLSALLAHPLPWWKRTLDILGAGAGLLALSPLFAMVGVIVKSTSRGPMFFLQQREGLGGKVFWMVKFRTMVEDADAAKTQYMNLNQQDGPAFKIDEDPRLTAIGKLLRKTNIDELPQLWNVLRGEMSLVGPRPLPVDESLACATWQRRRLDVTPGMTCVWQSQPRRNSIKFADWMRMDLAYAAGRSLRGDLSLILETIRAIAQRRGE